MKKVFLVLFVSAFVLSFNACNSKSDDKEKTDNDDVEAVDEDEDDDEDDSRVRGHVNFNGDIHDAVRLQLEYIGDMTEAIEEAIEDDKITESEAKEINEIVEDANAFGAEMGEKFDEDEAGLALLTLVGEEEEIGKIYSDYIAIMFKCMYVEGWDLISELD